MVREVGWVEVWKKWGFGEWETLPTPRSTLSPFGGVTKAAGFLCR